MAFSFVCDGQDVCLQVVAACERVVCSFTKQRFRGQRPFAKLSKFVSLLNRPNTSGFRLQKIFSMFTFNFLKAFSCGFLLYA